MNEKKKDMTEETSDEEISSSDEDEDEDFIGFQKQFLKCSVELLSGSDIRDHLRQMLGSSVLGEILKSEKSETFKKVAEFFNKGEVFKIMLEMAFLDEEKIEMTDTISKVLTSEDTFVDTFFLEMNGKLRDITSLKKVEKENKNKLLLEYLLTYKNKGNKVSRQYLKVLKNLQSKRNNILQKMILTRKGLFDIFFLRNMKYYDFDRIMTYVFDYNVRQIVHEDAFGFGPFGCIAEKQKNEKEIFCIPLNSKTQEKQRLTKHLFRSFAVEIGIFEKLKQLLLDNLDNDVVVNNVFKFFTETIQLDYFDEKNTILRKLLSKQMIDWLRNFVKNSFFHVAFEYGVKFLSAILYNYYFNRSKHVKKGEKLSKLIKEDKIPDYILYLFSLNFLKDFTNLFVEKVAFLEIEGFKSFKKNSEEEKEKIDNDQNRGEKKILMLEFYAIASRINSKKLNKILFHNEVRILNVMVELFFKYSNNNLLHNFVNTIIENLLNQYGKKDVPQEVKERVDYLINKTRLIDGMIETNNLREKQKRDLKNHCNLAHVLRLVSIIQRNDIPIPIKKGWKELEDYCDLQKRLNGYILGGEQNLMEVLSGKNEVEEIEQEKDVDDYIIENDLPDTLSIGIEPENVDSEQMEEDMEIDMNMGIVRIKPQIDDSDESDGEKEKEKDNDDEISFDDEEFGDTFQLGFVGDPSNLGVSRYEHEEDLHNEVNEAINN